MAEHPAVNRRVAGSSPARGAKLRNGVWLPRPVLGGCIAIRFAHREWNRVQPSLGCITRASAWQASPRSHFLQRLTDTAPSGSSGCAVFVPFGIARSGVLWRVRQPRSILSKAGCSGGSRPFSSFPESAIVHTRCSFRIGSKSCGGWRSPLRLLFFWPSDTQTSLRDGQYQLISSFS
jgi:hypothetical protein